MRNLVLMGGWLVLVGACGGGAGAGAPARVGQPVDPPSSPALPPAAGAPGAPLASAGTLDTEKVRATVAAAPASKACWARPGETFGAMMDRQAKALGSANVESKFVCGPMPAGTAKATWSCLWTVSLTTGGTANPDDPCGDDCCPNFQLRVAVDADGNPDLASATCQGAG